MHLGTSTYHLIYLNNNLLLSFNNVSVILSRRAFPETSNAYSDGNIDLFAEVDLPPMDLSPPGAFTPKFKIFQFEDYLYFVDV